MYLGQSAVTLEFQGYPLALTPFNQSGFCNCSGGSWQTCCVWCWNTFRHYRWLIMWYGGMNSSWTLAMCFWCTTWHASLSSDVERMCCLFFWVVLVNQGFVFEWPLENVFLGRISEPRFHLWLTVGGGSDLFWLHSIAPGTQTHVPAAACQWATKT